MKKTLRWSILFSLLLACAMISGLALEVSAVTNYHVYIGDTPVTSDNCDDVLGGGTVKFTPRNPEAPWGGGTLILKSPAITDSTRSGLIQIESQSVTVEGSAVLSTDARIDGICLNSDDIDYDLTLDHAELEISAGLSGIDVHGNVIVTGDDTNIVSKG